MRLLQQELQTHLLQEAALQTNTTMKGQGIVKTTELMLVKPPQVQHNAYCDSSPL